MMGNCVLLLLLVAHIYIPEFRLNLKEGVWQSKWKEEQNHVRDTHVADDVAGGGES